jgi:hypothetical protein
MPGRDMQPSQEREKLTNEAAERLLREGVQTHDEFIAGLQREGIGITWLNNFGIRLMSEKGVLPETAKQLLGLYLQRYRTGLTVQQLLQETLTVQQGQISEERSRQIARIRAPGVQDVHREYATMIEAARALPPPLPDNAPLLRFYQGVPELLTAADRELRAREISAEAEADVVKAQQAEAEFPFIVGNAQINTLYSEAKQDPKLKEILFQLMKNLILNHGYTFTELYR